MNIVRSLRQAAALTQQQLAARCQTSQSTIAAYETASKSPTIRTVLRLARCCGIELQPVWVPVLSREDRRSLAYHQAVATVLLTDSAQCLSKAKRNLRRLQSLHSGPAALFERWARWLQLPPEDLVDLMLSLKPISRDMRQVSPFAGVLPAAQRVAILKKFRQGERSE